MNDDERLRQTFQKLRAADARRVPAFEAIRTRPAGRQPRSIWAVVGPVAGAMAAAAVMVVWCAGEKPAAIPSTAANTPAAAGGGPGAVPADTAPLDFLLDLPNRRLLATAPRLDTAFLGEPIGAPR